MRTFVFKLYVMSDDPAEYITKNSLNEAITTYITRVEQENPLRIAHKNISYENLLRDKMLLVDAIHEGIPIGLFNLIRQEMPYTDDDWADFLDISKRSLDRFKAHGDHVFKSIHSEKIFELAEVTQLGNSVFDTPDDFYTWLNTKSLALGNKMPITLLGNSYGKDMVINELHAIDQGIFV